MPITIRRCTRQDAPALSEIGKSTFYETWSYMSDEENMQLYMAEIYDEGTIANYLESNTTLYYCAETESSMIGFVKLRISNENPAEISRLKCLEIAQVYVNKRYHNKKVGSALMEQIVQYATEHAFEVLWLSAYEDNERAMSFYENFGFEKFSKHPFVMGNMVYEDILMKKKL